MPLTLPLPVPQAQVENRNRPAAQFDPHLSSTSGPSGTGVEYTDVVLLWLSCCASRHLRLLLCVLYQEVLTTCFFRAQQHCQPGSVVEILTSIGPFPLENQGFCAKLSPQLCTRVEILRQIADERASLRIL